MPPKSSVRAVAATSVAAAAAATAGTLVHAYRRVPHMVASPTGIGEIERHVEVKTRCGEKIKFLSNDEGHVVGLVKTESALRQLLDEIPEAYILYEGGENVPELPAPGSLDKVSKRPEGDFVLEQGEGDEVQYTVLDPMSDEELRAFGASADIEAEAMPEALKGPTLRRAIYNLLGGQ